MIDFLLLKIVAKNKRRPMQFSAATSPQWWHLTKPKWDIMNRTTTLAQEIKQAMPTLISPLFMCHCFRVFEFYDIESHLLIYVTTTEIQIQKFSVITKEHSWAITLFQGVFKMRPSPYIINRLMTNIKHFDVTIRKGKPSHLLFKKIQNYLLTKI